VHEKSSPPYLFGDLLALARQSWVRAMAAALAARGFADYRRSDAAALRMLARGPTAVGRLGALLGVTRQAARKVVAGLEQRGYARLERDKRDSRRLNVVLTAAGEAYARAVVAVVEELNRDLCGRVDPDQLVAADTVLRAAIAGADARERAALRVAPPRRSRP